MIAQQMTYCSCSSDGCFAQAKSPRDRLLELTLSEDGERLSGTLYNQFGDGQPLILERVP
jgi:hypothetical protein